MFVGVAIFGLCCASVRGSGFALLRGKANAAARVDVPQTLTTEVVGPVVDLEHAFPECLNEGKVNCAKMARMLVVPHNFLFDFVFEHGLSTSVDTVLAAARVGAAAYDSEAAEIVSQAAVAPNILRSRSGEDEKMEPSSKEK